MPTFTYQTFVSPGDEEDVYFSATFKKSGSAAYHLCDIPGPVDKSAYNEDRVLLGKGAALKVERTVVYSKPVNINSGEDSIDVDYYINGDLIASHTNLKSVDQSPLVKININFQ